MVVCFAVIVQSNLIDMASMCHMSRSLEKQSETLVNWVIKLNSTCSLVMARATCTVNITSVQWLCDRAAIELSPWGQFHILCVRFVPLEYIPTISPPSTYVIVIVSYFSRHSSLKKQNRETTKVVSTISASMW